MPLRWAHAQGASSLVPGGEAGQAIAPLPRLRARLATSTSAASEMVATPAGPQVAPVADAAPLANAAGVPEPAPSIPAHFSWDVFMAHLTYRTKEIHVPRTWKQAHAVFWLHPTCMVAGIALSLMLAARIHLSAPTLLDPAALLLGAGLWVFQEWFIHRYLFHGDINWFGKDIHHSHHLEAYHHISIDGVELTLPVILITAAIFTTLLGRQLGLSCEVGYVAMGLLYLFTHYAVHTRAVPRSKLGKALRQHHMQHHCRNENYWLSFTLMAVDSWMGTNPVASEVPMTDLAKAAVKNRRL